MKYKVGFLPAILLVAMIPAVVGAQGFPGAGGLASLGLPSLGGLLGSGACSPVCDPKAGGGVAVDVGYVAADRGVAFETSLNGQFPAGLSDSRYRYALSGLWLGGRASGAINDQVGFYAGGFWVVPANRSSSLNDTFGNSGQDAIDWSTRNQWYAVEAAGLYSPYGSLAAVAGFRFDSFSTKFNSPDDPSGAIRKADQELQVSSYMPYVGVILSQGYAKAGILTFVYFPGTVKYAATWEPNLRYESTGNFKNSFFLEAFADYGTNLMGGYVGVFGRWTYLHASGSLSLDRSDPFLGYSGAVAAFNSNWDFNFDRANWVLGGKLAFDFASPM